MNRIPASVTLSLALIALVASAMPASAGPAGSLSFIASTFTTCEECGTATITLRRTGGDDGAVSVTYTVGGGSASAGLDYVPEVGTVTWPDNDDDPKSFTVTVLDDSVSESSETVTLTLTNPTGTATLGSPSTATLTITDNDTGGGDTCTPTATEMCLNDGRFKVSATWTAADGSNGQAQALPLTADSGYLWFFGPDNIEVIVKVLDACGINQHRWVFVAGLTDVYVELTVEDTVAGTVKGYGNPQGTAFQPIQDTEAFAACP